MIGQAAIKKKYNNRYKNNNKFFHKKPLFYLVDQNDSTLFDLIEYDWANKKVIL